MNYDYKIIYKNITLRPLKRDDIKLLMEWRNNKEENKFLKKIPTITMDKQIKWYEEYLKNDKEVIFAICETERINKMVGSLSLYNIKNNVSEVGRIQIGDKEAHGMGIGKKSLVMIMKFGFEVLNLNLIIGTVNKDNMPALINDIAIGFKIIGEENSISYMGGREFNIEIDYDRMKRINDYVADISIEKE